MPSNKNKQKNSEKRKENKQEVVEQQQEEQQEAEMTPEERANQYAEKQMEVFNKFLADFSIDEKSLEEQPNFDDKRKELEKAQKEETKRQEKLVRRELNDFEDLFAAPANSKSAQGNKQLTDRIMKSIAEIKKIRRINDRMQDEMDEQRNIVDDIKGRTDTNMKKKKTLHSLCNAILKKNCDLYREHEMVLEDERQQRMNLASDFQEKMKTINDQINDQKTVRQDQWDINQDLRKQIAEAIADYKVKQEDYQKKVSVQNKSFQDVEKTFKDKINVDMQSTLKDLEKNKEQYTKLESNVTELTDQIKLFMGKFDELKTTITDNSKKFETFQVDIEQKKMQIKLLETEIENIMLTKLKEEKIKKEVEEDRHRTNQQIETLKKLRDALKLQTSQ